MRTTGAGQAAAQLKAAFDASFTLPITRASEVREDLLMLRVAERPFAVRIRDIAEVQRCPPLTHLPSGNPALAGLATVRGALVAVYDLAALVGVGLDSTLPRSCGILLCAEDRSVALRFQELLGHRSVPRSALHSPADIDTSAGLRHVVRIDGKNHDLVDVRKQLQSIRRTARTRGDKE